MIVTCRKQIPFHWIAFAILPWAAYSFKYGVISTGFLFSLKKFVENPAGLTFVLSLPSFISIAVQPIVSFLSDRIWTRFGRRKPFVGTSFFGTAATMLLMPFMPNFWSLLAVYMIYNIFADLNSPMEPLKQEIIPPPERGRATAAMSWCSNLATVVFWFVALGRFDDVHYMGSFAVQGETVIYWAGAMLMLVMGLLITLGIREMDQKSPLQGQRFTLRNFFGGLLDRELWPVYLLIVGAACMNFYSGLGALSNLLYTEQWSYTKQEMGVNVAAGGIINVFAIALLAFFADRLNRMRAYQTLITLSLIGQVFYYCYIEFVLPDKHPSLVEIIVFGETLSILGILTGMVYIPLVYDYVRRNKMGTYNAGAQLVTRLTVLVTLNGVGLFVWAYATLFQPPAGEMTRLVLQGTENNRTEVLQQLRNNTWTYPQDGTAASAKEIDANTWQANGTFSDTGRGWEIRLRNKDSEKRFEERENLKKELSPLEADEKMLRDEARALAGKGRTEEAAKTEQKAAAKKSLSTPLLAKIETITSELDRRAALFRVQAEKALEGRLIREGDQVLGAFVRPAVLFEIRTAVRPDIHLLEKSLGELRHEKPVIIDVRPLKLESGYGIAVSAVLEPGHPADELARECQSDVERVLSKRQPNLFSPGTPVDNVSTKDALTLDLMILEEPLETYVSPITRVVNVGLALFDRVPAPDRRLAAAARNLRIPTDTNHVRASAGPVPRSISVTAVLADQPTTMTGNTAVDPLHQRFASLLASQPASITPARTFYERIEKAAATQKMTVAHPMLTTSYAAMKYDYMSGYLWMFIMSLLGILITFGFCKLEARGFVHKRGAEESEQS